MTNIENVVIKIQDEEDPTLLEFPTEEEADNFLEKHEDDYDTEDRFYISARNYENYELKKFLVLRNDEDGTAWHKFYSTKKEAKEAVDEDFKDCFLDEDDNFSNYKKVDDGNAIEIWDNDEFGREALYYVIETESVLTKARKFKVCFTRIEEHTAVEYVYAEDEFEAEDIGESMLEDGDELCFEPYYDVQDSYVDDVSEVEE